MKFEFMMSGGFIPKTLGTGSVCRRIFRIKKVKCMQIVFTNADKEIAKALNELQGIVEPRVQGKVEIELVKTGSGLFAEFDGKAGQIGYHRKCELFRAVGLFAEKIKEGKPFKIEEKPAFQMLCAMLDQSRNAVLCVASVKRIIRILALMGYTSLMLYTEDTYEVKGYPYFGYMRGRFTAEEIHELDMYAKVFGIELIPCIQTLAHLNAALRWPAFETVHDCGDILLAGDEKTYELIDAMFRSVSEMFSSRTINIGMDEAEMVGLGRYLAQNGYHTSSEVMKTHLARVIEICRRYGFRPMMWSDMFFKMASSGQYYGGADIPESITSIVPKEVSLVYWDYYQVNQRDYEKMMDSHLTFHNPIVFAGGAWKWSGFAPDNHFSIRAGQPALRACREKGISEVIVTAWGDDGAECSTFSILPVLQLYAEECYGENSEDATHASRLRICADADFDAFMSLDLPNRLPGMDSLPQAYGRNPSKWMFYQDVLCGLFDKHIKEGAFNEYYRESARRLTNLASAAGDWAYIFETLARLCSVLEIKCDLGVRLKRAYDEKDGNTLGQIARKDLPELIGRVRLFTEAFRAQWLRENKAFGLDVVDIRLGGLMARLDQAVKRIEEYRSHRVEKLEELEEERLPYDGENSGKPGLSENSWSRIVSASAH